MGAVLLRTGLTCALFLVAGCGLRPDPPPQLPITAFSGNGDLMSKCMAYASQSYCELEILGGGEH